VLSTPCVFDKARLTLAFAGAFTAGLLPPPCPARPTAKEALRHLVPDRPGQFLSSVLTGSLPDRPGQPLVNRAET
jgi:hypothetical protein